MELLKTCEHTQRFDGHENLVLPTNLPLTHRLQALLQVSARLSVPGFGACSLRWTMVDQGTSKRSTAEILLAAEQTLETAEFGLHDLMAAHGPRRMAGFRNLVTFGRAVTNVLQGLRSTELEFESWYQPRVEEMRKDPLIRHFYQVRSKILKQGITDVGSSTYIENASISDIIAAAPPPPPGESVSLFIGDAFGGSGWEVTFADGTKEKYYFNLPKSVADSRLLFSNSPKAHLGQSVEDESIEHLCELYISYLRRMLAEARSEFF